MIVASLDQHLHRLLSKVQVRRVHQYPPVAGPILVLELGSELTTVELQKAGTIA
jgi:hypothetical protein